METRFFRARTAVLLLVFYPLTGLSAGRTRSFRLGQKDVPFTILADRNITISSNCVSGEKLGDCEASRAIRKADLSKMERDFLGRNPGALLCSEQLGGAVVWSRDARGNERTFCSFKDGSLLSSGTLAYYGRKNAKGSSGPSR